MADGVRAAVVLGSGGARGYAHVGALQVLRERGIEVVAIAGTSMGALVGGVAAAGKLDAYTEWALSLTQREVWRLLDVSLTKVGGVSRADRVIAKVGEILDGATIESLPIPYTAVATDLNARREVWFQHGPVEHAIRASIAIPGVITPITINGRTLVDGGLINPVPIEPTAAVTADVTIAISLSGMRSSSGTATPVKETSEPRPREEWALRLRRGTAEVLESERLRAITSRLSVHRRDHEVTSALADDLASASGLVSGERAPIAAPGTTDSPVDASGLAQPELLVSTHSEISVLELLNMSFETMSALISRYRMASNPPDILVTVPSNAVRTLDFHRAAEMIELGRQLTTETLDQAGY
ncbi:esterase [Intrasporangium oryzae NRRL B-24470]|uniref:Esterase n=1 Tax=Intrasporangium oryzae NRRL B-24470 TaxID=1386089 RepID=W9GDM2_9MICO|nr:patatin-like phospholipase family protein [Intrasporangium oryzae]EWT03317.1 esterase [Intrasporangium oryzae NRRL B-24470]